MQDLIWFFHPLSLNIFSDLGALDKTSLHFILNKIRKNKIYSPCILTVEKPRTPSNRQTGQLGLKGVAAMRILSIGCHLKIPVNATGLLTGPLTALQMPSILSSSNPAVTLCLAPGAANKSGGPYQRHHVPGTGLV